MKKADIILIVSLLLIAVIGLVIFRATQKTAKYAHVYHYGEEILTLDLAKDKEYSVLDGTIIIIVKKGEVGIKESDCHDQICVHLGMSKLSNKPIICAPNGIYIKIDNNGKGLDVIIG